MLAFLYEASRTAGTAMVLIGIASLLMGMAGMVFAWNASQDPRGPAALRLARQLAVCCGAIGLAGALLAVPYFWVAGEIADRTFMITEMGLLGVLAVWAVMIAILLDRGETS